MYNYQENRSCKDHPKFLSFCLPNFIYDYHFQLSQKSLGSFFYWPEGSDLFLTQSVRRTGGLWLLFSWPGTEKQDLLGMNIARCSIIHLKSTDHLDQLIIEINRSTDLHDTAPPSTSSPFPILIVQWRSSGCFLRLIHCLFVLSSFWPINDP